MSVVTGGLGLPEEGSLVALGLGLSELDLNAMTAHLAGSGSLTGTLSSTASGSPMAAALLGAGSVTAVLTDTPVDVPGPCVDTVTRLTSPTGRSRAATTRPKTSTARPSGVTSRPVRDVLRRSRPLTRSTASTPRATDELVRAQAVTSRLDGGATARPEATTPRPACP